MCPIVRWPSPGEYRFTGCTSFRSLAPVWTYLGPQNMDTRDLPVRESCMPFSCVQLRAMSSRKHRVPWACVGRQAGGHETKETANSWRVVDTAWG